MYRFFLLIASLGALSAVAMGAFGAHGLHSTLDEQRLAIYHIGVQYHIWHSLALGLLASILHIHSHTHTHSGIRWIHWAGGCFTTGIVFFSGSLYAYSLSGIRWFGMVTPLGGVAFLLGWMFLAWFAWRLPSHS